SGHAGLRSRARRGDARSWLRQCGGFCVRRADSSRGRAVFCAGRTLSHHHELAARAARASGTFRVRLGHPVHRSFRAVLSVAMALLRLAISEHVLRQVIELGWSVEARSEEHTSELQSLTNIV